MSEPGQGSDRLTDLSTRLRAAEEARARYTEQDPRSQVIAFRAAVVFLAGTVVALAGAAFWIAAYSALFAAVLMIPTSMNWWRETRTARAPRMSRVS